MRAGRFRLDLRRLALAAGLALVAAACSELLSDGFDYGTVEVEVARRSGEPVPGVRLVLYTGTQLMGYGETDGTGRFTFDFVPPGEYGVRAVPVEPFTTLTGYASVTRDRIAMEKGEREEVGFTLLKRGPGTIRVRVRDDAGAAVPGTAVALYASYGGVAEAVTGPAGEHEFPDVPFGDYGVRIEPTLGYVVKPGRGGSFVDGVLVEEGSLETLDFMLQRCTGSIRVGARDSAGHGVPRVRIALYTFRGSIAEAVTDAAGVAEFPRAPCANLGVALQPGEGYVYASGRGSSFFDGIELENGGVRELSFTVTPCTGTVRVKVADASGAAVPGARLQLYSFRGILSEGSTNAGGAFEFAPAPCGDLGVKVTPPAGYSVEEGRGSSYVDGLSLGNGAVLPVSFVLTRS